MADFHKTNNRDFYQNESISVLEIVQSIKILFTVTFHPNK